MSEENEPITPAEFAERMQVIKWRNDGPRGGDNETDHRDADVILIDTLRSLGYGEGCDLWESIGKWYS